MNYLRWLPAWFRGGRSCAMARGAGEMEAVLLDRWPTASVMAQWRAWADGSESLFFQTPIWQQAVRRHLGWFGRGRLRVILIRRGNDLAGIIPLEFRRRQGFQTPAPHISDYLEPLICPDCLPDATRLALRLLRPLGNPLTLHNLRPCDLSIAAWPSAAEAEGWTMDQKTADPCPALLLPKDEEQWLCRLSAHARKELRRKMRKVLRKGDGRFEACPADKAGAGVDQLIVLMQHRYQKAIDVRRTLGPILRQAAPELIRRGKLRLSTLYVQDRPAACILESQTSAGPMLYNSGFDTTLKEWSPGLVAVALSIRRAIAAGHRQYDFMRGDEPYKYDLGAEDRPLFRLVLRPLSATKR